MTLRHSPCWTARLFTLLVVCSISPLANARAAWSQARAVVTIPQTAGQSQESLQTVKALLETELARRHVYVVRDPGFNFRAATLEETRAYVSAQGIARVFELQLLPIGRKLFVILTEREVPTLVERRSARLDTTDLEEIDRLLPRLVESVLGNKPLAQTETIQNVTTGEARVYRKKPGEFHFGIGLLAGSPLGESAEGQFGGAIKFAYELPHVRMDFDIGGMGYDGGHFDLAVRTHYLFSTGNITPYLGGGLGLMVLGAQGAETRFGGSLSANFGVEFFRLYRTRLLLEGEMLFPLFALEHYSGEWSESADKAGSFYNPVALLKVGLLW